MYAITCHAYSCLACSALKPLNLCTVVNPRRACAARVTVVVCLSVTLNLTSRVFVRLTKDTTYLTGNECQTNGFL